MPRRSATPIVSADGLPIAPMSPLALQQAKDANRLHLIHPDDQRIRDKERTRAKAVKVGELSLDEIEKRLALQEVCPTCGCAPMSMREVIGAAGVGLKYGVGETLEVTLESKKSVEQAFAVLGDLIPVALFPIAVQRVEELLMNMMPSLPESTEETDA